MPPNVSTIIGTTVAFLLRSAAGSALAARSRERLAKWTDLPLPEGVLPGMRPDEIPPAGKQIMDPRSKWFQQYHSLGEHEGCGILLMIAKLDPCGKGKIEAQSCRSSTKKST